jgi:bacterioferritin
MVREDLELERAQVNAYTAFIREVGFKDPTTRRLLEDILKDTEHHAAELRDMLSSRAATK